VVPRWVVAAAVLRLVAAAVLRLVAAAEVVPRQAVVAPSAGAVAVAGR
jgi:hypothetical protein